MAHEPQIENKEIPVVRTVLESVRTSDPEGLLKPEAVVEAARPEASPLHKHFQWDDTAAAHQWRLNQARNLIRQIEVILPDDPGENLIPRYVSLVGDRGKPGGGYRETKTVLNNAEFLAQLEATAKKELEAWTNRYAMLQTLVDRVRTAAAIPAGRPSGKKPKKVRSGKK